LTTTNKKYTLTAALPYANGALHLGHLAGVYVPADIYARFLRLRGEDVLFVCGSDEHGAAITMRAKKEGISPQAIIDKYHGLNKETFEKLGISFDFYGRTSSAVHKETAQEFFTHLYQKNEFEERPSEQLYDEKFQQFLADRYIVGTCPKCAHTEAYGDQCERCGSDLSPDELINPRSVLSGEKPVLRPTKHWYFLLNKHADWLLEWVKNGKVDNQQLHNAADWREHVKGQCYSWLVGGLQPRAITRDLDWGVPVPLDEAAGKVLYVWFDAPIGYISASKEWAATNGKNWEDYWKKDAELVHFIGKDNIVFHCVIFPAMLKSYGEFVLPKNVPANQFLNLEGRKFSKSKGWVIEQHEYLKDFAAFANKEDALRYALIKILPENSDSDFKWDEFTAAHDNELADNLGNFINRVLSLTQKYYQGQVPAYNTNAFPELRTELKAQLELIEKMISNYQFKDAMTEVMRVSSRFGNAFLQEQAPWKIYNQEPNAPIIADTLGFGLEIATLLSLLLYPFLPFTSDKIRTMLGLSSCADLEKIGVNNYQNLSEIILKAGHNLGTVEILFAKINDKKDPSRAQLLEAQKAKFAAMKKQFEAEEAAQARAEATKPKEAVSFDEFSKMDLRIGTIISAEAVKKSDKLLKLQVDLGSEIRTVMSGIAQHYQPQNVINQQVVLVANLAPRKIMNVESHGMILMASDDTGKMCFVSPTVAIAAGAIVK